MLAMMALFEFEQENTKMGILIHIGIGDVYYYFIEGP
jgi:hypothetical protein